jgi:hypothetical protein
MQCACTSLGLCGGIVSVRQRAQSLYLRMVFRCSGVRLSSGQTLPTAVELFERPRVASSVSHPSDGDNLGPLSPAGVVSALLWLFFRLSLILFSCHSLLFFVRAVSVPSWQVGGLSVPAGGGYGAVVSSSYIWVVPLIF